jgi:predicted outer membrane protein
MIRKPVMAVLALAALGLTACDDRHDAMANPKICADFKASPGASAAADPSTPVDECARRWAYSLAGSRDGAEVVADAVVAACAPALSRWNQASLGQATPASGEQALSLSTGQPTNPLAEHTAFTQGRALLSVVQARAGRCKAPPAENGAPTGL